ncbi:hypothetical protein JQK87_16420 [Streptomyces sp. G44]|uniref:hypothetical protein n=1 Tax=Streptomyces sp. G44 TaxID=2807632 RepID=UPI001962258D|nr:hypothetical protein [Streptomyces sp. G44]MBM7169974.1 hypothetical protein [Streptomyces sp. G44]
MLGMADARSVPALEVSGVRGESGEETAFRVPHHACAAAVSDEGSPASFLSGLLDPDCPPECVQVYGVDARAHPADAAPLVGLVPEGMPLREMPVREALIEAGVGEGLDRDTAEERTTEVLDAFELRDTEHVCTTRLLPGQRSRVAIGSALLPLPRLLLLCDPFDGVDSASEAVICRAISRFTASTGTVVFSTGSTDVADRVADHLLVIRGEQVVDFRVAPRS